MVRQATKQKGTTTQARGKGQPLVGMVAIREYLDRSESTTLRLVREEGLPAAKIGGIWESRTDPIDEWRQRRIAGRGVDEMASLGKRLAARA